MKFPRSIRWKLQLWYGGLLLLLLGGFGFTAYRLESARQFRRIDEDLQRRLPILVNWQRPVPGDREKRQFRLPPKEALLFDQPGDGAFYYVVWLKHGEPVTRSATAPTDVPQPKPGDAPNRVRGDFRESFLFPGPGDCVLVGRSIAPDLAGLHQFSGWLLIIGGAVFATGIAGGAWLVARALRPIQTISTAAQTIATGDLTQRIQTHDTDSELGQLANILNTTFARLEAAFARQSRFTADAAHELRTPLAVILLQTQNGLASDHLTEEQREAFAATQRAAQRMRRLTESLLTLARIDSGERPAPTATFDLSRVVEDATNLLLPLATQHSATVTTSLAPAPCAGNPDELAQVVTNLLGNALAHNPAGVNVRLEVRVDREHAVLTVSDTGQGISADDLPHLFERFYRVDKARAGASLHTGLGLAITQAIVSAHGGMITAESRLGEGTVMTVRLPLAPQSDNRPQESA
jgi:two-component system OmpR family sensor kinase